MHRKVADLERTVAQLSATVDRQGHTVELMSEFIQMQLGINEPLLHRITSLDLDRIAHRRMIDNIDARVGQLEGL